MNVSTDSRHSTRYGKRENIPEINGETSYSNDVKQNCVSLLKKTKREERLQQWRREYLDQEKVRQDQELTTPRFTEGTWKNKKSCEKRIIRRGSRYHPYKHTNRSINHCNKIVESANEDIRYLEANKRQCLKKNKRHCDHNPTKSERTRSLVLEKMLHQLVQRRREEKEQDALGGSSNGRGRLRGRLKPVRRGRGRNLFGSPDYSPTGHINIFDEISSEESGEERKDIGTRFKPEIRQDNIESLITDFEEGRDIAGTSFSELSDISSPLSDRQDISSKINEAPRKIMHQKYSVGNKTDFMANNGQNIDLDNVSNGNQPYWNPRKRLIEPQDKYENSSKHPKKIQSRHMHKNTAKRRHTKNAACCTIRNKAGEHMMQKRLSDEPNKSCLNAQKKENDAFKDTAIYFPALMGCRSVECYEWLNRIAEGTYGVVHRGKDKNTGEIVALKKLKFEKEKEGFPITSLREINMLLKAKHPNVVHVKEIVVGSNMDKIFIVMEYMEQDLKKLMELMPRPFTPSEIKMLTLQLLDAVNHLHDNWILHRDLKLSNLLLNHKGILKVGDFGLAREYGSPLKPYTPVVVTLWYRCPELLLGEKEYSTAVDMWSVGCIFAEFIQKEPLFKGKSEIEMIKLIFKELGPPNEDVWPGYTDLPVVQKVSFPKSASGSLDNLRNHFPADILSENGYNLLKSLLTYDPSRRMTAAKAMIHQYFKESPLPVSPSKLSTWPTKTERKYKRTDRSPKPPSGGRNYYSNKHSPIVNSWWIWLIHDIIKEDYNSLLLGQSMEWIN